MDKREVQGIALPQDLPATVWILEDSGQSTEGFNKEKN